ncbi:hypothetical protein J6590_084079, partial [Homalodisca vitripennis]
FEEIRAVAEVEESVAVGWIVWQARARSALSLTFEEIRAVAEVEESVAVGWIVWQARARSALSLTYDIEDGNSDRHFTINPTTGVVSTQHPLDYETRPSYNLTVSATNMRLNSKTDTKRQQVTFISFASRSESGDRTGSRHSGLQRQLPSNGVTAEIGLVVDIVDCNDNSPRFPETEYQSRHYRKTKRSDSRDRAGSRHSGLQRQLPSVSRDRIPKQTPKDNKLSISRLQNGVTAEIGLVVDVVDCNDNSPRFLETEYQSRHYRKTKRSDSRDRAGSRRSGLQRQLPSVSRDRIPKQTPKDNKLSISRLQAGVRAEIGLVVDVVDCNDNSPRFLETEYRGRISEDATPGSLVLTDSRSPLVVKAEDADSAILHYDIVESVPRRIFYIDPSTGAIRTQGQLDYEQTQSVTFHVQVRDTGSPQLSGRDLATVWVQITDVNDCPPHFSQTEYNTTVLLPTFNNVSIAQVQASDCDSPNITKLEYSIVTGNYENVYAMSGDSGLISLKNKSRGIHKSPHRLKVAVSDGPHTAFAFVNIKWEWSSESTLKFQQDVYEAAIVENSTKTVTVAVVSVVGAELNEHVVFSLLNPSPLFHIGPTSGAIQTTGLRFDREHQDHFQLIVQGRSTTAGAEVRVAQTLVNISVLDINDNCPLFVGLPYYGTVPVDAAKGDVITKACGRFGSQYTNHVHAIDLDSGENGEVRYELMRGHGELFRVHRKTGEVILKQPLESQVREYQLSIAAYDGGMTPCSTEVWVHLTVVDRTLPLFDKQFYTAVVPEDVAAHTVVPVTLDTHVPHGMKLYYSIVAGNEYEIFTIDFGSGVLRVADELDFEDAQEHSLTVKATDLHSGVSAETLVKVKITDINDCHPEFPVNMYHTTVSEAAAPGSFVIKVSASDKDTGHGGVIRYSLKTLEGLTSDHFTIEPEDGSVYLKKSLDREIHSSHKLVVVATDTGIPNLSTSVHLWVKVLDTNDNPPQFARSVFVSQLSSEAVRGQFVCRVQARDPDLDRLQYNIVSRGLHHMFSIEADTGVLQLMKLPKSLPVSPLELNVSVSDGVHMSFCTVVVDLQHADRGAPVFLADHYEVSQISVAPVAECVCERWGPYELLYSCRGPVAR